MIVRGHQSTINSMSGNLMAFQIALQSVNSWQASNTDCSHKSGLGRLESSCPSSQSRCPSWVHRERQPATGRRVAEQHVDNCVLPCSMMKPATSVIINQPSDDSTATIDEDTVQASFLCQILAHHFRLRSQRRRRQCSERRPAHRPTRSPRRG